MVYEARTLRPGSLAWVLTISSTKAKEAGGQKKGGCATSFCSNLLIVTPSQGQPSILRDQEIKNSHYGLDYYNTLASF